ncbi:hypothetical protein B0H13DRAFT_1854845 [Mycena leptocephala]|nr:hypothetical protein B0H13DRAFT_1854845 [Mycena leptocephala]
MRDKQTNKALNRDPWTRFDTRGGPVLTGENGSHMLNTESRMVADGSRKGGGLRWVSDGRRKALIHCYPGYLYKYKNNRLGKDNKNNKSEINISKNNKNNRRKETIGRICIRTILYLKRGQHSFFDKSQHKSRDFVEFSLPTVEMLPPVPTP